MATWGRGRDIVPSIQSVLAQDLPAFELIVVGDACSDDTAEWVASLGSDRVRWVNLPERCGSQSLPNNHGLSLARGKYAAYIGHDDVWAPFHLSSLAEAFAAQPGCSFAIGGVIFHGPEGSGWFMAGGLFEADGAQFDHFFPPCCMSHTVQAWRDIGPWRPPAGLRLPVDCEFQMRAAIAGFRFCSTGRVSVHKFSSVQRYLSYIARASTEQAVVLARLSKPEGLAFAEACLTQARANGCFMTVAMPDPRHPESAQMALISRNVRGLAAQDLVPVDKTIVVGQSDDRRGLDWYPLEALGPKQYRWSGPNPRPKMLLPFVSPGPVEILFEIAFRIAGFLDALKVEINGAPVGWHVAGYSGGGVWLGITCNLLADASSVVTFSSCTAFAETVMGNGDKRRIGMLMGDVILRPKPQD